MQLTGGSLQTGSTASLRIGMHEHVPQLLEYARQSLAVAHARLVLPPSPAPASFPEGPPSTVGDVRASAAASAATVGDVPSLHPAVAHAATTSDAKKKVREADPLESAMDVFTKAILADEHADRTIRVQLSRVLAVLDEIMSFARGSQCMQVRYRASYIVANSTEQIARIRHSHVRIARSRNSREWRLDAVIRASNNGQLWRWIPRRKS